MNKILTALLTAILLVVSLSSCASKNNQNNTESTSSNEKKPGNIYYQEDGLPEKNFNGADFVFLTATDITGGEMTSMDSEDVSDPLVMLYTPSYSICRGSFQRGYKRLP